MKPTAENIFTVLFYLVENNKGKNVSWKQMVAAVNQSGMKIANWMSVRNVLQFMINEKMVKRTADIHVEEFEVL